MLQLAIVNPGGNKIIRDTSTSLRSRQSTLSKVGEAEEQAGTGFEGAYKFSASLRGRNPDSGAGTKGKLQIC